VEVMARHVVECVDHLVLLYQHSFIALFAVLFNQWYLSSISLVDTQLV
jgi:hypothetical protein